MVVSEGPSGRVFIDPTNNHLSINQVTEFDAGLYSCVASSRAGTSQLSVPVYVQDINSKAPLNMYVL